MEWWIWIVIGLACLGVEMLAASTFVFLFFGIAALVVGGLAALGVAAAFWLQSCIFAVTACGSLLLGRRPLLERVGATRGEDKNVDTMIGEVVVPVEDIAIDAEGKAECRGSSWTVHNADDVSLRAGQRCRVVRVAELTLWIKAG